VHTPAISTVHAVLDRHGLVKRRAGRRNRAKGTPRSPAGQPNDLWYADYKGEFMLIFFFIALSASARIR